MWAQTTQEDTVNVKPFEDLTLVTDGTVDTSDQFLQYDISAGLFSYRLSLGELLKKAIDVPNIVGSSQIVNGSILDTDISGSAGIGLNKLATGGTGNLLITDSGGSGTWEAGTAGYGVNVDGTVLKVDTSELATQYDLTQLAATGGIWEEENSNTLASDNTTDNYHAGNIGIGDFSGTTIGATIHAYDVTNVRLRLSDSAANDTVAQAFVEYYRGYATNKLGQIGYTDNTDLDLHIENHLTGGGIEFRTDNVEKMKLFADGQLSLPYYGDTLYTGTAVKYLAVTDDGLVIETDGGGATNYTPTSGDTSGSPGDLAYDDNNFYVRTSSIWKKIALSTIAFTQTDTLTNIGSLEFHLDAHAELLAGNFSNGDPVTTAQDWSGNNYDATSGSGPTLTTNEINGRAAFVFDGTNDSLAIADNAALSAMDSITFFAVVEFNTLEAAGTWVMTKGGGAVGNREYGIYAKTDSTVVSVVFDESGSTSESHTTSGKISPAYVVLKYEYDDGGNTIGAEIDGTGGTSATTLSIDDGGDPVLFGKKEGTDPAGFFDIKIAECFMFSKILSAGELTSVETYLNNRYGITF